MNQKESSQDPRFYYVRIIKIENSRQWDKALKGNYLLKLQLGTKYSTTTFEIAETSKEQGQNLAINKKELDRITEEAHIFKYGAQEFMNLFLQELQEQQCTDKEKDNSKAKGWAGTSGFSGFSRILLTPLIQHPHICHEIVLPLIGIRNKQDITGKPILYLTIQIYFQLSFKATLDIIPLSAIIGRSIVPVGQMRPVIELKIEKKRWISLDSSGIHPHWSGHYHAKRNRDKSNRIFSEVTNIEDNIEANKWNLQQRRLSHDCNLSAVAKQAYFDISRFQLTSAGSFLEINIYSKPFQDKPSTVVGSALIRIQNANFFKYPRDQNSKIFTQNEVDLFRTEGEEPEFVGKVHFLVRFIFDKDQVLNPGPYTCEMPISKTNSTHNRYAELNTQT